jgi:TrmH family RNA methyltransferase
VHLLVAGETVAEELLARVSTLPHPARAIGVYRRADMPTGMRGTCLALWRLSDPGNVGTLLRSADAFDACVALSDGCADPLSPKALRASAGAIFRTPLIRWDDRPSRCLALVAHGGAPLSEADLTPPVTLLLGAERAGLPDEQMTRCHKATIAVADGAESLNVAAAGAIALYEASRAGA